MSDHSFYTRQMLSRYGRQLVSARRLARYEFLLGKQELPVTDFALRRKAMVERIAREIVDNLIFSGSENPIVAELHKALEKETDKKLEFKYPPANLSYKIFEIEESGEKVEVTGQNKKYLMDKLWEVTLETVNATML